MDSKCWNKPSFSSSSFLLPLLSHLQPSPFSLFQMKPVGSSLLLSLFVAISVGHLTFCRFSFTSIHILCTAQNKSYNWIHLPMGHKIFFFSQQCTVYPFYISSDKVLSWLNKRNQVVVIALSLPAFSLSLCVTYHFLSNFFHSLLNHCEHCRVHCGNLYFWLLNK